MLNTPGRSNWLTRWLIDDIRPVNAGLCDFDQLVEEVRIGDVLLIEGRSRVSDIIKLLSQSPWSHSILYIGKLSDIRNNDLRNLASHYVLPDDVDKPLILEALFDEGVTLKPVEKYRGEHIRICRPASITNEDSQKVINYALKNLGKTYNTRHIFDLLRFLLPIRLLPRRWLSTLFDPKHGKLHQEICSTMLANAFTSVGFPVRPIIKIDDNNNIELIRRNPKLFTPSDFDYSPYFEIIKYPIYGDAAAEDYRTLNWNKDGILANNEEDIFESDH